jgi:DNA repair exonuclease SbcCD ATPase subunit
VPVEIGLDDAKNTLFIGANGAGKSTFLDAICFALFGKPFRKINKGNIVNSINEKDCLVEIEFTTNNKRYKIVRGAKPNKFEIYSEGKLINQDAAMKDYQTQLEKTILRMNYKSFTQIVILGAATFTPFMSLSPADRRSVIEDLLDIQIFSVMNNICKQKSQTNKELLEKNRVELGAKKDNYDYANRTLESLQANSEEKLRELIEKRDGLETDKAILILEIDEKESETDALLKEVTTENSLRKKHTTLISLRSKIENNWDRTRKETEFFLHNSTCPTCTQDIDKEFATKKVEEGATKADEQKKGIDDLDSKIEECLSEISRVERILEHINILRVDLSTRRANLKNIDKLIKSYEDQIAEINKKDRTTQQTETEIAILKQAIKDLDKIREKLLDERTYIETGLTLLKDGGIKTKIIKQYIPIINKHINKYLAKMGFFVNYSLNENFEETIKSRHRDEFMYNNFSEGEKLRIDLAILLTWRDIARMKNSVNTNLLIFDEVLDRSMDASGIEEFLKIMWDFGEGTNVFVISHKDAMVDRFERIYKFEKVKSFSTLTKDN